MTDAQTLERIESIVIPPAWDGRVDQPVRDRAHPGNRTRCARAAPVPISPALGAGSRRHQVRAHARVRPRAPTAATARQPATCDSGDCRARKVVAAAVRLLETALIRVGNEEYARENRSFGVTTLRGRHAKVSGSSLRFSFRGKSGKEHSVALDGSAAGARRSCVPGPARTAALPVRGRGRRGPAHRLGRRQRLPARGDGRGVLGEGFPDVGGNGPGRPCAARTRRSHEPSRRDPRLRPSRTSPQSSATRPLCVASATSTRR